MILVRIFPPPCVLLFFARLLTSCCKKLPPDRSVSDFLHSSVALRVSRALPQNPVKRRYEVVCLGHSFLPAPSENFQNLRTKKRPQIYLALRRYHRLRSFVNTFLHSLLVSATGEFHACMKIRLTQDTKEAPLYEQKKRWRSQRGKHRKDLSCQLLFYHVQCTPDNFIHIIIFILSQASAEQDICFLFRKLCILCIECAVFLIVDRIVRFVTLFPGRGELS